MFDSGDIKKLKNIQTVNISVYCPETDHFSPKTIWNNSSLQKNKTQKGNEESKNKIVRVFFKSISMEPLLLIISEHLLKNTWPIDCPAIAKGRLNIIIEKE